MDRAQPVLKKSLEKKRIEHDYKIHQEKLKKAKSSIDCHNTANWTHLKTKSKKLQKDEERYCEIERDNALLLAKMSTISRGKGDIDTTEPNRHNKYSMNIHVRTLDQTRIQSENQAIVTRIRSQKGQFNHTKYDDEWKQTQKMINRICEYPFALDKSGGMNDTKKNKTTRSKSLGRSKGRHSKDSDSKRSKSAPRKKDKEEEKKEGEGEGEGEGESKEGEGEGEGEAKEGEGEGEGEAKEGEGEGETKEGEGEEKKEEDDKLNPSLLRRVARTVDDHADTNIEEHFDSQLTQHEKKLAEEKK